MIDADAILTFILFVSLTHSSTVSNKIPYLVILRDNFNSFVLWRSSVRRRGRFFS